MGQTVFFKTSFWTDPKMIDTLAAQERFFYLYLMTSSQSNMVGCFEISTRITCSHTGFNEEEVQTLLSRLVEYNVIRYSQKTHEVLILNYAKHNWTKSSKFLAAAYKLTKEIKDFSFKQYVSRKLIEYGFDQNDFDYEIVNVNPTSSNFGYGIQKNGYGIQNTEGEGVIEDIEDVTDDIADNESRTLNTEDIPRTKKDNVRQEKNKKEKRGHPYTEEFETFWAAYPRKVGKGEAFKSFAKATSGGGADLQTLLNGVEMYKKTQQWKKQGGAYIPNPATWLNQKRWEDSPDTESELIESTDRWAESAQRVINESSRAKEIETSGYW